MEILDMGSCTALVSLPHEVGNLTALQELRLVDCELMEALPSAVWHLPSLCKLDLAGCTKLWGRLA